MFRFGKCSSNGVNVVTISIYAADALLGTIAGLQQRVFRPKNAPATRQQRVLQRQIRRLVGVAGVAGERRMVWGKSEQILRERPLTYRDDERYGPAMRGMADTAAMPANERH